MANDEPSVAFLFSARLRHCGVLLKPEDALGPLARPAHFRGPRHRRRREHRRSRPHVDGRHNAANRDSTDKPASISARLTYPSAHVSHALAWSVPTDRGREVGAMLTSPRTRLRPSRRSSRRRTPQRRAVYAWPPNGAATRRRCNSACRPARRGRRSHRGGGCPRVPRARSGIAARRQGSRCDHRTRPHRAHDRRPARR